MLHADNALDPKVASALIDVGIAHRVIDCDPELADTAAFCEHYGYKLSQSANTIVVAAKNEPAYAACVVLASTRLDVNKKVCQLLGVKRASFANAEQTKELTGMMIGGVVAVGISNMPIYVDAAVMRQDEVVMGGGNRSSKLILNPSELKKLPGMEVIEGLAKPSEA